MSLVRAFRPLRNASLCPRCQVRYVGSKPIAAFIQNTAEAEAKSSCPPNTVLAGVNYLKGQPPVLALPDEEYPDWLWKLLEKKELPDDGPGGKAEKVRLRRENRQRIREQNFLKTQ